MTDTPETTKPTEQVGAEQAAGVERHTEDPKLANAQSTVRAAVRAVRDTKIGKDQKESVARMRAESQAFFGVPVHVVAGAFHQFEEFGHTEITRAQARAAIEAWSNAPAHTDRPDDEQEDQS